MDVLILTTDEADDIRRAIAARQVGTVEWAKAQLAEYEGFYGAADRNDAIDWIADSYFAAVCDITYDVAAVEAEKLVSAIFDGREG